MTMADFQKALDVLLAHEGGYVNDPDDSGGPTNFGVTQSSWDTYRNGRSGLPQDVKDLTKMQASAFYHDTYWLPLQLSGFNSPVLALVVLDLAVLAGAHAAVSVFQKTLGVEVDGELGPTTLEAANREGDDLSAAFRFVRAMAHYYVDVARGRPGDLKFLSGWIDRLFSLADYIDFGELH